MRTRPGTPAEDPAGTPADREADRETVVRVLRDAAALGPYFAVTTDPAEEADPTWRPLAGLDAESLRGLIGGYARRLGTGEERVAASILFQGLAARLWSPVVAAAVHGVVPDLARLHWRWAPGAPIALWLPDPGGRHAGDPAGLVRRTVVDGHLRRLAGTVRRVVPIAEGLLWGNAASALAGTLGARTVRPGPHADLVRRLLAMEPLTGTGALGPGHAFVRRSCCLYYRVPPGGEKCGDCVLVHATRR
jgi:hypothetical protein